jgi:hypothetical protein
MLKEKATSSLTDKKQKYILSNIIERMGRKVRNGAIFCE